MNNSGKTPEKTAKIVHDTSDDIAEYYITNCTDKEYLREALKYEAENKAREARIAKLNQKLYSLE